MSCRSRRSSYKPPFVDYKLLKKIQKINATNGKKFIKTYSRRSSIIPPMIGFTLAIHNGKKHVDVFITRDMVAANLKLGDMVLTRKFGGHAKEDKAKTQVKKGPAKKW